MPAPQTAPMASPSWSDSIGDLVVIESFNYCGPAKRVVGTPEDVRRFLHQEFDRYGDRYVFKLSSSWSPEKGCSVSFQPWDPFTCQGGFGSLPTTLRFVPSGNDPKPFSKFLPKCMLRSFQVWSQSEGHTKISNRFYEVSAMELFDDDDDDDDGGNNVGSAESAAEATDDGTVRDDSDEEEDEEKDSDEEEEEAATDEQKTKSTMFDANDKEAIKAGFECLFHILMNCGISVWEVGLLKHELAYEALCGPMQSSMDIEQLEFANSFGRESDEQEMEKTKGMTMNLCCRVIEKSKSITNLYFPGFDQYSPVQTQQLFQALNTNTSLNTLDLRNGRYIHTWNIADKVATRSEKHPGGLAFDSLIHDLVNPNNQFSLKELDLSGLVLSTASVVSLAEAMPRLELETILLRDTALDCVALTAIARALRHDNTMKKLDISHNSIGGYAPFMEELCDSLKENRVLHTLKMEHCDMRIGPVEILARTLPGIQGLRNLSLNGNEFGLSPRCVVVDENNNDSYVGVLPVGPILLVDAMEKNTNIEHLSVSLMGGPPGMGWGMVCCTAPPYNPWMSNQHRTKLQSLEARNKRIQEENRKTKMQEAVVRLAGLMRDKINRDDDVYCRPVGVSGQRSQVSLWEAPL